MNSQGHATEVVSVGFEIEVLPECDLWVKSLQYMEVVCLDSSTSVAEHAGASRQSGLGSQNEFLTYSLQLTVLLCLLAA